MDSFIQKERRKSYASLLSWLLCIVPSLLGIVVWLALQSLVETMLAVSGISTWSWDAVQMLCFLSFGVLWLVSVFVMQHGLYKSTIAGTVWNRFALLNGLLLLLLVCSQAARFMLGASPLSASAVVPVAGEAALMIVLFFIYRQTRKRQAV